MSRTETPTVSRSIGVLAPVWFDARIAVAFPVSPSAVARRRFR
jgi:hypothetical protein